MALQWLAASVVRASAGLTHPLQTGFLLPWLRSALYSVPPHPTDELKDSLDTGLSARRTVNMFPCFRTADRKSMRPAPLSHFRPTAIDSHHQLARQSLSSTPISSDHHHHCPPVITTAHLSATIPSLPARLHLQHDASAPKLASAQAQLLPPRHLSRSSLRARMELVRAAMARKAGGMVRGRVWFLVGAVGVRGAQGAGTCF